MKPYNKSIARFGLLTILAVGLFLMIGGTYGFSWMLERSGDVTQGWDALFLPTAFAAGVGAVMVIVSMIVWRSNTSP